MFCFFPIHLLTLTSSMKGQDLDHVPVSDGCNVSFTGASNVRTWALDREAFQNIMRRTAETRHEQYRNFLRRLAVTTIYQALLEAGIWNYNLQCWLPVVLIQVEFFNSYYYCDPLGGRNIVGQPHI